MRAVLEKDYWIVIVYNKNEEIIWAGKKRVAEREYWKRLLAILEKDWEYKTPYHDDKAQLEIPFSF